MISLVIDGMAVTVPEGTTILKAASGAGIYIPHLCSHPDLPPVIELKPAEKIYRLNDPLANKKPELYYEGCQLCVVEIEGKKEFSRACNTPVTEGAVIRTSTPALDQFRTNQLTSILAKHPHACLTCAQKEGCARFPCSMNIPELERCCPKFSKCEFQKIAEYLKLSPETPRYLYQALPHLKDDPLFERNYNLCIGCTRCVRVCREVRGVGVYDFVFDDEGRPVVGTAGPGLHESACRFCTACVEVCPTGAIIDKIDFQPDQKKEVLLPCVHNCPAGIDIPSYLRLVAMEKPDEALAVIREQVPLPAVLGRVCMHPCESECRRGKVNDSISICAVKRYAAERNDGKWKQSLKKASDTGKKVAIVGSGPAGLTAAFYLRKEGHSVTLFEQSPEPGGMLRYGIPGYRLPQETLDADIKPIIEMGIELKLNSRIKDFADIERLKTLGYDALFLSPGSTLSRRLDLPGADLPEVLWGVDFLRSVREGKKIALPERVLVIGGGNVAVDVALSALRLGAGDVSMACLESRDEMPAHSWEIEGALEEGIKIFPSLGPKRILGDKKVSAIELIKCTSVFDGQGRFNPTFDHCSLQTMETEMVILAIGQAADLGFLGNPPAIELQKGLIKANPETGETNLPWIFAGGDGAKMPGSIIEAIDAGKKAASSIDRFLGGSGDLTFKLMEHSPLNPYLGREEGFSSRKQEVMPSIPLSERKNNFKEIAIGFSPEAARKEAGRCLQCDLRLQLSAPILPPKKKLWVEFNEGNVSSVPEKEGVYQLFDEQETLIYIKGAMNLLQELKDQLELNAEARFFAYVEDQMFSKRESEMLQHYIAEHGKMPKTNQEMEDLF